MNDKNKKIRTIFIGTPEFAIPCLKALINDEQFEVITVITQPDKPVGRKKVLTAPPVKSEAIKNNIPVLQPEKIREFRSKIELLEPDIIVVAAYAQLIPEKILEIPKYGCMNVHASLLPKYRGAAIIHAPIENCEEETGVTIMKMDAGLDTGPILSQIRTTIESNDTTGTLSEKLAQLGAKMLIPTITKYIAGELQPTPQDHDSSSYIGEIKKEYGRINFGKTASEIECFIRAMNPWPSAYAKIEFTKNKKEFSYAIKIIEVEHTPLDINNFKVGEIFEYESKLAFQCGNDALLVNTIQLEGKKEMPSQAFLRGHGDIVGKILK